MSIHINTPAGQFAAVSLVDRCIKTANSTDLHGDVLLAACALLAVAVATNDPSASQVVAGHLRNVADKIDGGCFDMIGQFADYEAVSPQVVH